MVTSVGNFPYSFVGTTAVTTATGSIIMSKKNNVVTTPPLPLPSEKNGQ